MSHVENGSVQRSPRHQHNIDQGQHPDQGSSCCALFAAGLALNALRMGAHDAESPDLLKLFSLVEIEATLQRCVAFWGKFGRGEGIEPLKALETLAEHKDVRISIFERELVANRAATVAALSHPPPYAVLITAIPRSVSLGVSWTGDTFVAVVLPGGIRLVDTHHHAGEVPDGLVSAHFPGNVDEAALRVVAWVWNKGGLLEQLHCGTEFVEISAFRLDGAKSSAGSHASDSCQGTDGEPESGNASPGDALPDIVSASAGGSGAMLAAPLPQVVMETAEDHDKRHPNAARHTRGCARCRWKQNAHRSAKYKTHVQ